MATIKVKSFSDLVTGDNIFIFNHLEGKVYKYILQKVYQDPNPRENFTCTLLRYDTEKIPDCSLQLYLDNYLKTSYTINNKTYYSHHHLTYYTTKEECIKDYTEYCLKKAGDFIYQLNEAHTLMEIDIYYDIISG